MTREDIIDICNDNEFDMDWNSERGLEFREAIMQSIFPHNNMSNNIAMGNRKNKELITNFTINDESIYKEAIQLYKEQSGKDILVIRDDAYDIYGGNLMDCKALLFTPGSEFTNLTDFWKICRDIRNDLEQSSIDLD